uniref:Protein prenyltransferase alpha subunit repeat containing 1 n=1 Tax=Scophthalmus maximus TaxID=52904 RepID=A0A8D3B3X7_SCOMX
MAESEEEVDVLVQRVVKDIANAFKRNPSIDEIGVIPCPEARYNRSPIVLVENKLGVESWCVKFLLPYVHNKLLLFRQRKQWLDREALVDITCTLLLLNPDFTTAWNVRKELMQCGVLIPEKDLYLGKLALTKFPKSPETWIHRRWVLQQILRQSCAVGHSGEQQQQQQEMKVCSDAACRYPSNYNAWSHRIWVLQHMAKGNVKVFHDELSSMRLWVSMHVSDHSGFHYRQFLLQELTAELSQTPPSTSTTTCSSHHQSSALGFPTVPQLFHQEMELCSDLIQSFPGHETLWSHRRHVFYLWHHVNGRGRTTEPMEVDRASLPDPRDSKRLKRGVPPPAPHTLPSEHSFVRGVLDRCSNTEQRHFVLAYKKWLDTLGPFLSQH